MQGLNISHCKSFDGPNTEAVTHAASMATGRQSGPHIDSHDRANGALPEVLLAPLHRLREAHLVVHQRDLHAAAVPELC